MLAKLFITLLVGTAAAFTSLSWADDDDDDAKRRRHRHGKQAKVEVHHHHHHYWHLPSGAVLERSGPPPPPAAAPRDVLPPPALNPGSRVPESFPKESRAERSTARERQRGILESELSAEQELLARARKNLAAEDASIHERNIAALRRELGNLNR